MNDVKTALGGRLESLFDREKGLTKSALARFCGVSTAAVAQWLTKGKISPENLRKAAQFFSVNVDWLATGKGDARLANGVLISYSDSPLHPDGYIAIPEYDLDFAAGGGAESPAWIEISQTKTIWYSESYLHSLGAIPSRCRRARVIGDSMEPTLENGDIVLFEEFSNTNPGAIPIVDGDIYMLSDSTGLRVKRVAVIKNGLLITSDNPKYQPETYTGDDAEQIRIYGRVIESTRVYRKSSR